MTSGAGIANIGGVAVSINGSNFGALVSALA